MKFLRDVLAIAVGVIIAEIVVMILLPYAVILYNAR